MKQVLVIDDNQQILSLIQAALPQLGVQADFASSGHKAIKFLKAKDYDLILTDIRMPDQGGIDVATAAYQKASNVPILFMSGADNVLVEDQSFLKKPFTITQLRQRLRSHLCLDA